MDLYACGFNAHCQLSLSAVHDESPEDLHSFQRLASGKSVRVLFAGWTETVFLLDNTLFAAGYGFRGVTPIVTERADPSTLSNYFGDHKGFIGAVSRDGTLFLLSRTQRPTLQPYGRSHCVRISHIALAGNGAVAVAIKRRRASPCISIVTFSNLEAFTDWYSEPRSAFSSLVETDSEFLSCLNGWVAEGHGNGNTVQTTDKAPASHSLPVPCVIPDASLAQLAAGATFFILLTSTGTVYTWGDARHGRTLGRDFDRTSSAEMPGIVHALGGIAIRKISAGGWIAAALSKDMDGYLWGGLPCERLLRCLEQDVAGSESATVVLVEYEGLESIRDVAVGGGHVAFVSEEGKLWLAGEGENGQLGVSGPVFAGAWVQPAGLPEASLRNLYCGNKSTFVACDRTR